MERLISMVKTVDAYIEARQFTNEIRKEVLREIGNIIEKIHTYIFTEKNLLLNDIKYFELNPSQMGIEEKRVIDYSQDYNKFKSFLDAIIFDYNLQTFIRDSKTSNQYESSILKTYELISRLFSFFFYSCSCERHFISRNDIEKVLSWLENHKQLLIKEFDVRFTVERKSEYNLQGNPEEYIIAFDDLYLFIYMRADEVDRIFTKPYDHAQIHNFLTSIKSKLKGQIETQDDPIVNTLHKLLQSMESEFLDFKLKMYEILSNEPNQKMRERLELLRDTLSLINIKRTDNIYTESYLVIGVGEKDGKYDGTHQPVEFTQYQTIIQLIQQYLNRSLTIDFYEAYLSGDKSNILIARKPSLNYDRILLIKIRRELEQVYEISKQLGNNQVGYLEVGESYTRDESHKRRLTESDRIAIRGTRNISRVIKIYHEIFNFLDDMFQGKGFIGDVDYITEYLDNNSEDLLEYFQFQREKTTAYSVQNYRFLKNKYRIHFLYRQKLPTIYLNDKGYNEDYIVPNPLASKLYEQLKKDIKDHLNRTLGVDID